MQHEPLTLVLFEGVQLVGKVGECTLLPTKEADTQTSPTGLCVLFPQRLVLRNANFHEFPKSSNVRPTARHLADRC